LVPIKARINWEGCNGIKMMGMMEVMELIARWSSVQLDCWHVCLWYLPLHHKIQKMACGCLFWYQLTWVVPVKEHKMVVYKTAVCVYSWSFSRLIGLK